MSQQDQSEPQDLQQEENQDQDQEQNQEQNSGEQSGEYEDSKEDQEEYDDEDPENQNEEEEEEEKEDEQDNFRQYLQQEQQVLQWCKDNDKDWEDPDFPADNRALFKDPNSRPEWSQDIRNIKWKRPSQIAVKDSPQFMIDKHGDYKQGGFGESSFIGAIIIIATRGDLLAKLIVEEQYFNKGFVTFQFFKNGQWKQVMVDTLLPWDEDSKQILFTYCANPQEFWIPLMEKAYAKLHGCYENICDGLITEMLVDLSGGVSESWELNDQDTAKLIDSDQFWQMMMTYYNQKFYLGCVNHIEGKGTKNADTGTHGILENHHYGICDIRAFPREGLKLVRIRNVWGSDGGWNGPFCDDSEEWDKHRTLRTELNLQFKNKKSEGTWWMSYNDWFVHFNNLFVCKVFPETWETYDIDSKWQGKTQGGICPERAKFSNLGIENPQDFQQLDTDDRWFNNPQFRLKVTKETKLYISLMLEDKKLSKQEYVQTNFMVITSKNRNNRIWERPANSEIINEANPSGELQAQREITQFVTLKRFEGKNYGYYVIVPNMIIQGKDIQKKDHKRIFYLRIFASDPIDVIEMPETIEKHEEGGWNDNSAGGKRKIEIVTNNGDKKIVSNPFWCKNPQYFLNLSEPTHLKIILQKTGTLRKTKGIKVGLSICRYDAPKDKRSQQKEKQQVPVKKATQGQAQGSNLARLLAQTGQQLEPPELDIIERKLQIAYAEQFKESVYQSDESSALYFSWNPTEGPFVILPSLDQKDKSATYKLTIFSNNPVELRTLDEKRNSVLIGDWVTDVSDGGCHLYEDPFEKENSMKTWTQNPKFVLKFTDNTRPCYLKITLAIADWKKTSNNTVERLIGVYLINKTETKINWEDVVKEPNFVPITPYSDEFYLQQINPNGYYIMPTTYQSKITGTFILSVTSSEEFTLEPFK